ncbi:TPA: type I toxin-antitoxin system Ibs family toxin [Escherichia coli]|nr:type I toxin-antitoxin system Ibs family toxin [Escherichia coli]QTF47846.1 type I toxin-antitoxin system Ibs family toxin [Escherichia coli H20]HAM5057070.1 type I toxin-antitoxin system Ibs family toxin [Escherichia coli]HCO8036063.1 type I toxin-antitoxin system Ibs family toxin [Escherichia coli]
MMKLPIIVVLLVISYPAY